MARRPNGLPPIPNHSIRVPDDLWNAAKEKAYSNGETVGGLMNRLLKSYVEGEIV